MSNISIFQEAVKLMKLRHRLEAVAITNNFLFNPEIVKIREELAAVEQNLYQYMAEPIDNRGT